MNYLTNLRLVLPAIAFLIIQYFPSPSNDIAPPVQNLTGPGGMEYVCDSVRFLSYADQPDGYWLFEPIGEDIDSAHVVVFTHGYGAYNPMVYGDWIRHIVRKGNIVIFPRYQKNLTSPKTKSFVKNTTKGIQDALMELDTGKNHVQPIAGAISLVGHSYGGVISANLAVNYKALGLPKPNVVLLCSPGSGPFKGGVLDSYEKMPEDTRLLIMVSEHDRIVKDKLGKKIYETAVNTPSRNLIRQFADNHGDPSIDAGHNESYSLNKAFDSGVRNVTSKRASRVSSLDAVDYFGYWKLFDALLDCSRSDLNCEYAFGNTEKQRFMGKWSDGQAVKELEILSPVAD